jgi:multiple sugar transport system ATP-binding protein
MTLADRIVVMRDGRIEQVDNPIKIFQNPTNVFVAGFIGSPPMNLHPAVIVNSGDEQKLRLSEQLEIPIPKKDKSQFVDGQKVIVGLRTEDIFIRHDHAMHEKTLTFPADGIVQIIEPLGNETNLHMDLQGAKLIARSEGRRLFTPGEKLQMTLDLKHLHIFDAQSEQSIY